MVLNSKCWEAAFFSLHIYQQIKGLSRQLRWHLQIFWAENRAIACRFQRNLPLWSRPASVLEIILEIFKMTKKDEVFEIIKFNNNKRSIKIIISSKNKRNSNSFQFKFLIENIKTQKWRDFLKLRKVMAISGNLRFLNGPI